MATSDSWSGRSAQMEVLESRTLLSANFVPSFTGRLSGTLAANGNTRVKVRLRNSQPTRLTETATVRLFASRDIVLDTSDTPLAVTEKFTQLRPGGSVSVPVNIQAPAALDSGAYILLAQVDGESPVAIAGRAVTYQRPFSDVGVRFSQLPATPLELDGPSAGRRIATLTVSNKGNIPARGSVSASFYLSSDGTLDSSDSLLAIANRAVNLKPGASRLVRFRIAVPGDTAVGAYFLFAVVTPSLDVPDINLANNTASSARRIAVVNQLPNYRSYDDNYYYYDYGLPFDYGYGYDYYGYSDY